MSDFKMVVWFLGVILAFAVKSVIFYSIIDDRFDKLENLQLVQANSYQWRWRSFEEQEAWHQFKLQNPHIEMEIPDIQSIKRKYKDER